MTIQTLKFFGLLTALMLSSAFTAVSADQEKLPAGTINFIKADTHDVLLIYGAFANVKQVTDSRVSEVHSTITLRTEEPMTTEQVRAAIEKALLEQAGIVIMRLDDKRVSGTNNDALPISPAEKQNKP